MAASIPFFGLYDLYVYYVLRVFNYINLVIFLIIKLIGSFMGGFIKIRSRIFRLRITKLTPGGSRSSLPS